MKNLLFLLFVIFVLGFGNSSFTHYSTLSGGVELPIVGRTASPIGTIIIPDKYFTAKGELVLPIEVSISKNDQLSTSLVLRKGTYIQLPPNLSGDYLLQISIGDFYVKKVLHL